MSMLVLALVAFIGTHFLLSHPLRKPLVARLGENGFLVVYSLVAALTLGWVILAYRAAPVVIWWVPPLFAYTLTHIGMIVAAILLVGSLVTPNPSLPKMGRAALQRMPTPQGVFALTRHPMMWGIGLWGLVHAFVNGDAPTVVLAAGMAFLAIAGARGIDLKKRQQLGAAWQRFEQQTAFWPLAAQLRGRLPLSSLWPGWLPVMGGVALYVVLVYFHVALFGVAAVAPGTALN